MFRLFFWPRQGEQKKVSTTGRQGLLLPELSVQVRHCLTPRLAFSCLIPESFQRHVPMLGASPHRGLGFLVPERALQGHQAQKWHLLNQRFQEMPSPFQCATTWPGCTRAQTGTEYSVTICPRPGPNDCVTMWQYLSRFWGSIGASQQQYLLNERHLCLEKEGFRSTRSLRHRQ